MDGVWKTGSSTVDSSNRIDSTPPSGPSPHAVQAVVVAHSSKVNPTQPHQWLPRTTTCYPDPVFPVTSSMLSAPSPETLYFPPQTPNNVPEGDLIGRAILFSYGAQSSSSSTDVNVRTFFLLFQEATPPDIHTRIVRLYHYILYAVESPETERWCRYGSRPTAEEVVFTVA